MCVFEMGVSIDEQDLSSYQNYIQYPSTYSIRGQEMLVRIDAFTKTIRDHRKTCFNFQQAKGTFDYILLKQFFFPEALP